MFTLQTSFKPLMLKRGRSGVKSGSKGDWIARRKCLLALPNHVQEFGLRLVRVEGGGCTPTEYTQRRNGRFLAYIPSWWKNLPRLVRVGGARPSPFTIQYFPSVQSCTLELRGQIHPPPISTLPLYVLCGAEKYTEQWTVSPFKDYKMGPAAKVQSRQLKWSWWGHITVPMYSMFI